MRGPLRTFRRVVLPQISVSVVDRRHVRLHHVVRPGRDHDLLVRPGGNTLPVEMFLYLQKWQDPTIAALSTLLILFAVAARAGARPRAARPQPIPVDPEP